MCLSKNKALTMKKILLLTISLSAFYANAQICSELFISEYVEGNYNNKALEIYNPTAFDIDLANYDIVRYSNGAGASSSESDIQYVQPLSGTIPSYSTFIALYDKQDPNGTGYDTILFADLLNIGNTYPNTGFYSPDYNSGTDGCRVMSFNGNDALALRNNGVKIDIFGKIGEDPGLAWTDDASAGFTDANGGIWWTRDQTLIRKSSVTLGVGVNPIVFDPTTEWDSLPKNTFTELGTHDCDCNNSGTNINEITTNIRMYPNPSNKGNIVILQSEKDITEVRIINMIGQTIRQHKTNQKILTIQTNSLAKGSYLIQVMTKENVWEDQLIVK